MKKKLFTFLSVAIFSLFVGYTQVKADETIDDTRYTLSHFYDNFSESYNIASNYQTEINTLINYWNNNMRSYSSDYVIIYFHSDGICADPSLCNIIRLYPLTSSNMYFNRDMSITMRNFNVIQIDNNNGDTQNVKFVGYSLYNNSYVYWLDWNNLGYPNLDTYPSLREPSTMIIKSSNNIISSPNPISGQNSINVNIPSYSDTDFNFPSYDIDIYDIYPTLDHLVSGDYNPDPNANYVTVNVNDYEYVILSLKDYTSALSSTLYIKGQLCLTSVYNYGMTEKNNLVPGFRQQPCSIVYDNYSPLGLHVSDTDISNHAIYYINAPSNNLDNYIKYDSSVFDITYITSSNVNNPSVIIGGRSYPVIPYSQLTDTAIDSTNDGYIPGASCAIGDINCNANNIGVNINDIFTQPLQLFKTMGSAITSVLTVITAFIMFLPPTLQAFLYTGFFLVVILGIVKVLL